MLRQELQVLRAGLEELGAAGQQSLEAEVDKLSQLLARHQADADATRSAMALRVQALETTNTQVNTGRPSVCSQRDPLRSDVLGQGCLNHRVAVLTTVLLS